MQLRSLIAYKEVKHICWTLLLYVTLLSAPQEGGGGLYIGNNGIVYCFHIHVLVKDSILICVFPAKLILSVYFYFNCALHVLLLLSVYTSLETLLQITKSWLYRKSHTLHITELSNVRFVFLACQAHVNKLTDFSYIFESGSFLGNIVGIHSVSRHLCDFVLCVIKSLNSQIYIVYSTTCIKYVI